MKSLVPRLIAALILWLIISIAAAQDAAPLPDGPVALITLGDSLTEGAEDSLELGGYPGRLLTMINAVRPGSTLVNLGHSGWNSDALITGDQGLPSELDEALKAIAIAKASGQIPVVLVWIGSNDLFYLYEYNNPTPDDEAADVIHYGANLDLILTALQDAGAVIGIAHLDDQSKRPVVTNGLAFPGTSKEEAARMSVQVDRYNEMIDLAVSQFGTVTIDFYNTTIFTDATTLADDGNHPNPAGYDIIAQRWYDALLPVLNGGVVTHPIEVTPAAVPPATQVSSPETVTVIPVGPIALVTLGDSLTEGEGDSLGQGGYPGRLLNLINDIRPGSTLVNVGHSGWSSDALITGDQGLLSELDEALKAINNAKAAGQSPVALVWIGSNDLWYLYEYGDPDAAAEAADVEHFAANLDTILSQLQASGATLAIALLDDQSKRPVAVAGQAFTGISKDELTHMSAQIQRYNQVIAAKASEYGALIVDFSQTTLFTDAATLADDGNHPNPAGYDIVAQTWFDVLVPAMNVDD